MTELSTVLTTVEIIGVSARQFKLVWLKFDFKMISEEFERHTFRLTVGRNHSTKPIDKEFGLVDSPNIYTYTTV